MAKGKIVRGLDKDKVVKDVGGRPTKLNDDLQERLVKVIKAGNYIETASAYVGISKNTLYSWLRRGEAEKVRREKGEKGKGSETKYIRFSDAIERALAEAEIRDVLKIDRASESQWQASAWRLERKFPEKWGRKYEVKSEVMGKDGGAIEINDARQKLIERLAKE